MMALGEVRGSGKGQGIVVGCPPNGGLVAQIDPPSVFGQVTPIPGQAKLLSVEQQL